MAKSMSLYSDSYCKVLKGELIIKCYFFPTTQVKTVRTEEIKGIFYDEPKFTKHFGTAKSWGMALTPIWWACDIKRYFHGSKHYKIVVVDNGDSTMKGFTVEDMDAFLNAIRPMLQPDVIIADILPF